MENLSHSMSHTMNLPQDAPPGRSPFSKKRSEAAMMQRAFERRPKNLISSSNAKYVPSGRLVVFGCEQNTGLSKER